MPTWTLYNLGLPYKNMLTAHGTSCVHCPAARRASAMVRVGSAMAMAPAEAMEAVRLGTMRSEPREDTIPSLAPNSRNVGLGITLTIVDDTGVKGLIGTYTPLHTGGFLVTTCVYSVYVCRPVGAALGPARS